MCWHTLTRAAGWITLSMLIVCSVTPAPNYLGSFVAVTPNISFADAVVVLAAGVMIDGTLPEESMRRSIQGIALYRQGLAPLLVLSGPVHNGVSEAKSRHDLALRMGIPGEAVLTDEMANTTQEEAARIRTLLRDRGGRKILLVTESLHMRRSMLVFQRAGFEVLPAPSDEFTRSAVGAKDRLWLALRVFQESAAIVYYRVAGYI